MTFPQDKPAANSPTTFLSLPLELRQSILLQSYKPKRPDRDLNYTTVSLLLEHEISADELEEARFIYTNNYRGRQRDQGQERDLEYYRVDSWVDKLTKAHESLREDLVFVQGKWQEAFEKEIKEMSRWRKEIGQKLIETERKFGLRSKR